MPYYNTYKAQRSGYGHDLRSYSPNQEQPSGNAKACYRSRDGKHKAIEGRKEFHDVSLTQFNKEGSITLIVQEVNHMDALPAHLCP